MAQRVQRVSQAMMVHQGRMDLQGYRYEGKGFTPVKLVVAELLLLKALFLFLFLYHPSTSSRVDRVERVREA